MGERNTTGMETHGFNFSAKNRPRIIEKMKEEAHDALIVGGGINGAVAAAALSAAGLKTVLAEKGDFGSVTSHASSNLVWGGIKYLENYEFGLVSKLCQSRNRLMKQFPENVREIRFFIAHQRGFRFPLWFLYCGTWLYGLLGRFQTRLPLWHSLSKIPAAEPNLNLEGVDGALEYSDAYLPENDSRFVLGFVKAAFSFGALPLNYLRFENAQRKEGVWECRLHDGFGETFTVRAKHLINAAGPYVDKIAEEVKIESGHAHLFSKGIHLILPKLTEKKHVVTFFANDGRLFFVIPMGDRSCVGTTDTRVDSPETEVTAEDRKFVLDNVNSILKPAKPLTEGDIISERCGVRPLVVKKESRGTKGDWFQLSREHLVYKNPQKKYLALYGGKLTDCLNIADELTEIFRRELGYGFPKPTEDYLGEPDAELKRDFLQACKRLKVDANTPAFASEKISERLWRRYGTHAESILELIGEDASSLKPIAQNVEIYRIEPRLSAEHEMVMHPRDFAMRRSLLGFTHPEIPADAIYKN